MISLRMLTSFIALTLLSITSLQAAESIKLATTTSTQDSGLLDELLPKFRQQTGIEVQVIAVGSGQALELGRRGDADVLLTHSPAAEEKFMAGGDGQSRRHVMHNDFVIVGPAADPAGIRDVKSVEAAMGKIVGARATFVSRGDESGTHQKEKDLWRRAKIMPQGSWYVSAGVGMAQALRMAHEKSAYTLSDRATFLAQREKIPLAILFQGDASLQNHYCVITLNPTKHPQIRKESAEKFAQFLLAPDTQKLIAQFGKARFGEPLFFANPEEKAKK